MAAWDYATPAGDLATHSHKVQMSAFDIESRNLANQTIVARDPSPQCRVGPAPELGWTEVMRMIQEPCRLTSDATVAETGRVPSGYQ